MWGIPTLIENLPTGEKIYGNFIQAEVETR